MGIAEQLNAYISGAKDKWEEQTLRARFWRECALVHFDQCASALDAGEEVQANIYAQLALTCEIARQAADMERPISHERGLDMQHTDLPDP